MLRNDNKPFFCPTSCNFIEQETRKTANPTHTRLGRHNSGVRLGLGLRLSWLPDGRAAKAEEELCVRRVPRAAWAAQVHTFTLCAARWLCHLKVF